MEIAEGAVWDRRPLAPGESRRYTLQYSIFVFRWPHALQKPIVYPTAELLTLAIPEELVVGGLDLERGPAQIIAGQTLETQVSAWLAPGVSWQVIVRPGPLAGPLAGWNEGLLDLPVLAELDRFPGDWLIQRAARNPPSDRRRIGGGGAAVGGRHIVAAKGSGERERGRCRGKLEKRQRR